MRLLHTQKFKLQEFLGYHIPKYAILSHTWGKEEVTFQDMSTGPAKEKKLGWRKIQFCCRQAAQDGFSWAWIDTCCIDKTSSAELSESINSMYEWYRNSSICYVYLQDCSKWSPFWNSRWWKRGWTLQELIAPSRVWFYNYHWEEIGSKRSMHEEVTRITGIDEDILTGGDIFKRNVAVRMSWAADRQTTRIEDEAYCLLGLFGVNMPLLYGEGDRAFKRLQEEILKVSEDYTLFTWLRFNHFSSGLLATAPSNFHPRVFKHQRAPVLEAPPSLQCDMGNLSHDCFSIFPPPQNYETPYMTSRGLHLTLPTWQPHNRDQSVKICITLSKRNNAVELVCVSLRRLSLNMMERSRYDHDLTFLPESEHVCFSYETFYVIEPRHEASVPNVWTDEDAPTILILKLNGTYSEGLSCYFSPWPSVMDLLQLDGVSDGEERVPLQVQTIQGPRPFDVPSLFARLGISDEGSGDDNSDDNGWKSPKAQVFPEHGELDQFCGGDSDDDHDKDSGDDRGEDDGDDRGENCGDDPGEDGGDDSEFKKAEEFFTQCRGLGHGKDGSDESDEDSDEDSDEYRGEYRDWKVQDFSRHGRDDQCLGNPSEHCWVVHEQDRLEVSELRSVLCFGLKGHQYSGFQIQIKISEKEALCQVIPTTTEILQNEANRQKWLENADQATFSNDRTTIQLSSAIRDSDFPSFRFAVSIRQVASSSLGFRRCVLSISDL